MASRDEWEEVLRLGRAFVNGEELTVINSAMSPAEAVERGFFTLERKEPPPSE